MNKLSTKWQVVLGGEGGQGLVVAGLLLGLAAVKDSMDAAQTASYGISSRGGFTKAEVVISDQAIEFPAVEEPNVILALSQSAMDIYYPKLSSDCYLVYDCTLVNGEYEGKNVFGLPLTEAGKRLSLETGLRVSLNIIGLGALLQLTGMVTVDALEVSMQEHFRKGSEANRAALTLGMDLIRTER